MGNTRPTTGSRMWPATAAVVLAAVTACGGGSDGENGARVGDGTAVSTPSDDAVDPGALPSSEVAAIVQLGATGAGPPPEHEHHGHHGAAAETTAALDDADLKALDAELALARSAIADIDTVEEAAALGYVLATAPSPGIGTHWVRWSRILEPFDPSRPAMLLFDQARSPAPLVGYSYALQSDSEPIGFAGEADQWHRHTGLCVGLDGWVVRERAAGPGECDGSFIAGGDFWMLHAWIVPGWENNDGMFAPMNPKLCPSDIGTPDYLRCPDEPQI